MPNFLKYGLMAGLLYAAYALILQFSGSDLRFNTSIGFAAILITPIIFMVMAVKAERSHQEGLLSFGEALKTSFLTYLIFIIIAVLVAQIVMMLYSPEDWERNLEIQRNIISSTFGALGMDQLMIDEEMDKITLESIKEQATGIGAILMGTLVYAFVGLITSLIISAIMKKNPTP